MEEVNLDSLAETINGSEEDVLCLIAPNYEPRSVLGASVLLERLPVDQPRFKFGLLTVQLSPSRVQPLEDLRDRNINSIKKLLNQKRALPPRSHTIPYPTGDLGGIMSGIWEALSSELSQQFKVILDISPLPRRVIIRTMEVLRRYCSEGRVNSIFLLYSWPERYPKLRYPTEVGRYDVIIKRQPLTDALMRRGRVHVAVFVGRQAYDAKQFIEVLPHNKDIHVYVFMNRDNPFHSWEVVRLNSSIIFDTSIRRVHYYLTLQSGHEKLLQWVESPIQENDAYLIAPFGPKPLTVSAWIAVNKIKQQSKNVLADIVLLSGHQESTPYSLGYKKLSVFRLDIEEVSMNDMEGVQG